MSKTKKSLVLSCLSMLLCLTMLIGSTFAWFTDNASTGVNTIQAGTLDVDLVDMQGKSLEGETLNWVATDDRAQDKIFWEPGCTYVTDPFILQNNSNLAIEFRLSVNGFTGDLELLDVLDIEIYQWDVDNNCIYEGEEGVDYNTGLSAVLLPEMGQTGDVMALVVQAHMKEEAGNEYQGMSLSGASVLLQAKQYAHEFDSFGNQYDANATYPGEANENWYEENKNNETLEITSAADLYAFANEVNENGTSFAGKTVKLTADIDLANAAWTPIGQTGGYSANAYFMGTFDGNGKTIKNLNVSVWEAGENEGKYYASGLFGFIDAGSATIQNLTVDGATVNGSHWTGVIAGYLTGSVENCTVKNATVTCTHKNDDACGDKAGAVVGYINDGAVKNCEAENCTVNAGRDAGQIVGAAKTTQVENCTATSVTVSAIDGCTGSNIRNEVIGRVL